MEADGLQGVDADPPIAETPEEVREGTTRLRGGKAAGGCSISTVLLKAVGIAMICGLHAVLTATW